MANRSAGRSMRESERTRDGLPAPELATVYVTTAIMTSAGPGPGALRMPLAEAGRLVKDRKAIYGSRPPRGFGHEHDSGLGNR
jgi:hypothetical protein